MNVLVACEESQRVCQAFLKRGHNAFSCDLLEPSGGRPDRHILGDALIAIHGGQIITMDGITHNILKWDLIIAHPPCTYLTNAQICYYNVEKYGQEYVDNRIKKREEAYNFFMEFVKFAEETNTKMAIENPPGYMNTHYRKPNCIIYPYQHGESFNKPICLWLFGLPKIKPTKIVPKGKTVRLPNGKTNSVGWGKMANKSTERSKTFVGIAEALAEQWG